MQASREETVCSNLVVIGGWRESSFVLWERSQKKLKMRSYNFSAALRFVRIMKRVARSSGSLSKLSSETARGSGERATGASLRIYVRPMRLAGAFAMAIGAGTGAAREGAKRAKNMRKKRTAVNAGRAIMLAVMFGKRDWWCVSWIRRGVCVVCVCTARVRFVYGFWTAFRAML